MVKGLLRSLARGGSKAPIRRVTYPLENVTVPNIDGATGVGWGTVVIGGLPEGNILLLGAQLDCTILEASAGVTATFEGDISVGTTATADTTLDTTDVDIIPSTPIPAAVASVATVRATSAAANSGNILNNTDGTQELNLNVLIDDASISADDVSLAVNGTLVLIFAVLGDD